MSRQCKKQFRYFADPICIGSVLVYLLNRFYLKPHHIGGAFTHGYLNDVLCLPLFLPLILCVQRVIRLRTHDLPPRLWEIVQHAIIFSVVFEVILPRYPRYFRTTADPLDALAYLVGGLVAGLIWWKPAWINRFLESRIRRLFKSKQHDCRLRVTEPLWQPQAHSKIY